MGASSFCAGHNSRWMGRRDLLRLRGEYVALNKLRKLFIKEYLVDLNATQAAKRAGYSEKTAYSMGQRLLKNVEVQKAIEQSMEERSSRTEITQDMVLKEYAKLAFFDPRKLFNPDGSPKDITELDDDTAAALSGLDVQEVYEGHGEDREFVGYIKKYKLADKKGALDSVGRHLGMFTDKLQVDGSLEAGFDKLEKVLKQLRGGGGG